MMVKQIYYEHSIYSPVWTFKFFIRSKLLTDHLRTSIARAGRRCPKYTRFRYSQFVFDAKTLRSKLCWTVDLVFTVITLVICLFGTFTENGIVFQSDENYILNHAKRYVPNPEGGRVPSTQVVLNLYVLQRIERNIIFGSLIYCSVSDE